MTTVEPEKQLKAINDASVTLESKAVVDRKFPDLYKTFTGIATCKTTSTFGLQLAYSPFLLSTEHAKYNGNASRDYKNVIVKKSIPISTPIMSEMQQCRVVCNTKYDSQ